MTLTIPTADLPPEVRRWLADYHAHRAAHRRNQKPTDGCTKCVKTAGRLTDIGIELPR